MQHHPRFKKIHMKNKTIASWLAFLGGPAGLHRFYLFGMKDLLGWLLPIPTFLGVYGLYRLKVFGVDDSISWVLLPVLGFVIAGCALNAIVYGLKPAEQWNAQFNPQVKPDADAGQTNWLTVFAIVLSLLIGGTAMISGITLTIQHYFEYQMIEGQKVT
jgi:hypothetical protein